MVWQDTAAHKIVSLPTFDPVVTCEIGLRDEKQSPLEKEIEMTDHSPVSIHPPIFTSYFECPLCEGKFSNETGAWQHCFMWHDEDIKIKEVRTWRKHGESLDEGANDPFGCSNFDDTKTEFSNLKMSAFGEDEEGPYLLELCDKCGLMVTPEEEPHNHDVDNIPKSNTLEEGIDEESAQKQRARPTKPSILYITSHQPLFLNNDNFKVVKNQTTMDYRGRTKQCPQCCEAIQERIFYRHEFVHKNASLPCPHCGGFFVKKAQLLRHMVKAHHAEYLQWKTQHGRTTYRAGKLSCPQCTEVLPDPYRLKIHVKMHQGAKVPCPEGCRGNFPKPSRLDEHLRIGHNGSTLLLCDTQQVSGVAGPK